MKVNCLIDTGANTSIIHPSKYYSIPESARVRLHQVSSCIRLADGGKIQPLGEVTLPLHITDVGTLYQKFLIAETNEPLVLGYDFFHKHQCVIDLTNNTVQIGGKTISCVLESKLLSLFRISLSQTITIPSNSEMMVKGYVQGSGREHLPNCALLEGSESLLERKQVLVARSLVNMKSDIIPVRVLNPNDQPKQLYKNTVLGTCSLVYSVDEGISSKLNQISVEPSKPLTQEHVQPLLAKCQPLLSSEQQQEVEQLLFEYRDIFAKSKSDLGRTALFKHEINTGNTPPIKQRPRRVPLSKQKIEREEVSKMLDNGVISPSCSPWSSPIVLVTKKDGSCRFCIDYRKLNDVTVKDSYSLPDPNHCLQSLHGSKWFSTLDLASGYWQMEVDPKDRPKTAFTCQSGLFEFNVMPFGLTNAPSSFERLMEKVLSGLQYDICLLYLDDIIIKSETFEEHVVNLKKVFDRLRDSNLRLSPKKCTIFQHKVQFLGHVVSEEGISTDPKKVETVKEWPKPSTVKQVRSFLGLCSYYRRFILNFSSVAKPLTRLTEKDVKFAWSSECEEAFQKLKNCLVNTPILVYPDLTKPFILDTDASGVGIGAVLSQLQGGKERVVAYYSRVLTKSERNYCVTRRELLAVIDSIKHFHTCLYGTKFVIRTDHGSLRWLVNFKNLEGQLCRWSEFLAVYDYEIVHRSGKLHGNADALSRRPCNSCRYCDKVESRDKSYQANVEDFKPCLHQQPLGRDDVGGVVTGSNTFQKSETLPSLRYDSSEMKEPITLNSYKTIPSKTPTVEAWLQGEKLEKICTEQRKDKDLRLIIDYKLKDKRPTWQEVSPRGINLKNYWSQWNRLILKDKVLYREWFDPKVKQPVLQVVIPSSMRENLFSEFHKQRWSGHLGIKRTVGRMRRRVYWAGYKADIYKLCQACPECQKRKSPNKKPRHPMKKYAVGLPMERVGLDILGPLPETSSGNKYILVVSDYFTKWVEAYPMPNQETVTIANVLVNEFISRFGVPLLLHSDQGSQFESSLFQELCSLLGIDKTRTTAYHPQSDGLVERFNLTLESMLSKYVAGDQRDWDTHLPMLMLAYRSSIHESTGQTPVAMMFGREVTLPIDLLLGSFLDQNQGTTDIPYIMGLKQSLNEIHEIARENLEKSCDRQKRVYDHRANARSYKVGDSVFLFDPSKKKGISPKLQSRWQGPYQIIGKLSDLLYKIQLNSKVKIVHHDRLKLAYDSKVTNSMDSIPTDLGQAVVDSETVEEDLESDLNHGVAPQGVTTRSGRKTRLPKKLQDCIL